jgi:r-opsin
MAAFSEPHYAAFSSGHGSGNYSVVDKVLPDMMHLIDPHWYQYPPMNPLWHSIIGFAVCVFGIVSMIGNACVIHIFTSEKTLRSPANLLIVNLAISDFMMFFTMGPPMVYKPNFYSNSELKMQGKSKLTQSARF